MERDTFGGLMKDFKPGGSARNVFYWPDNFKKSNIVWRIPRNIAYNDNIVVREDEIAVFFRDGKALQVFDRPDRYALTTQSVPVLGTLGKIVTGVEQIGEVYYVQKREFRGEFSSPDVLTYRDVDFGLVRIIATGQFAFKVQDPMLFITQFIGTRGLQHSDEIVNWLKDQIMMVINTVMGKMKAEKNMGILDMPAYLPEIEQICLSRLSHETDPYGIKIVKFSGLAIKLPDAVQQAIDKRSAMSALGVNYMQLQTGEALGGIGEGAAKGGDASGFAGLGAGLGAGYAITQSMTQGMGASPPPSTPISPVPMVRCPNCGQQVAQGVKFCPNCGTPQMPAGTSSPESRCPSCGKPVGGDTRFCPECGVPLMKTCTKCQQTVKAGIKFCPNCGNPVS
jgi:membrane protease subunit (stomatin/prohibitin family)